MISRSTARSAAPRLTAPARLRTRSRSGSTRTTAEYSERVFRANVPLDKIAAIMSAAEVNVAKQEGRVREYGKGEKITGFYLAELEAPPSPKPASAANPDDAAFQALKDTLKNGGVQVVVARNLFPTPKAVAQQAAELLDIQPGDDVLEPSAGTGMLLGAMGCRMFGHNPECGTVTAVEINPGLANCLKRDFPLTIVICGDFLEVSCGAHGFDKILMNPPFENGDDIKHILHAFGMLKPGGRLVAICANGPRQQAKLMPLSRNWFALPNDTFKDAGTSVRTAMIVLEKEMALA